MRMRQGLVIVLGVAALAVAGCGGDDEEELSADEVESNLEDAGYEVTDFAELGETFGIALPEEDTAEAIFSVSPESTDTALSFAVVVVFESAEDAEDAAESSDSAEDDSVTWSASETEGNVFVSVAGEDADEQLDELMSAAQGD